MSTPGGDAELDLAACDAEPIHVPGSVQPFGALVVVDAGGRIVQRSANLAAIGARGDAATLEELFGPSGAETILAVTPAGDGNPALRPHRLSILASPAGPVPVDVTVHDLRDGHGDGRIVSIEPAETTPSPVALGEYQNSITATVAAMSATTSVDALLQRLVGVVAELTGFDRVMAYRFEQDGHGVVEAEHRGDGLESYLGLHYPASDIPAQARRMYLTNWLRFIPDARYEPVPLEPVTNPLTGRSLDLSNVPIRSVSPVHLRYLANMGVQASMSISLVVEGTLWGLVACHHENGPRLLSLERRAAAEFVAVAASLLLGERLGRDRMRRRLELGTQVTTLLSAAAQSEALSDALMGHGDALLAVADADGAVIRLGGQSLCVGVVAPEDVVGVLLDEAGRRPDRTPWSTDDLTSWLEGRAEPGPCAGAAVLTLGGADEGICWFRQEWSHQVDWGGDPNKSFEITEDGDTRLQPRGSFSLWRTEVRGRARPWSDEELAAMAELRAGLGALVLGRAEHLAHLNQELSRVNAELDAFAYVAAHDLHEPLRGITALAGYLAADLGRALEPEQAEQLDMLQRTAARMGRLLDGLVEYSRAGRAELREEAVLLSEIVEDAALLARSTLHDGEAVIERTGDLRLVGDRDRLGVVFANLVSNAVKYSDGPPRISVRVRHHGSLGPPDASVTRPILDPAAVLIEVTDNGIGILDHAREEVFQIFRRLHASGDHGGGTGVGLTISRRIVERHGGTIWNEPRPDGGGGTAFYLYLPTATGPD